MAALLTADLIASVEKYLDDNWPVAEAKRFWTAAEVWEAYDNTDARQWAAMQWIGIEPAQASRAKEDWCGFEFRMLCFARENDRLAAAELADAFKDLLRSSACDLIDRSDGSTQLGNIVFNEISITPPERDERGIVLAVVEIVGWATLT